MTEDQEDQAFEAQTEWIKNHLGEEAAKQSNYGWFIDDFRDEVGTKVYGHGILTTHVPDLKHTWEEM